MIEEVKLMDDEDKATNDLRSALLGWLREREPIPDAKVIATAAIEVAATVLSRAAPNRGELQVFTAMLAGLFRDGALDLFDQEHPNGRKSSRSENVTAGATVAPAVILMGCTLVEVKV